MSLTMFLKMEQIAHSPGLRQSSGWHMCRSDLEQSSLEMELELQQPATEENWTKWIEPEANQIASLLKQS